jgi:hypothetical protein
LLLCNHQRQTNGRRRLIDFYFLLFVSWGTPVTTL